MKIDEFFLQHARLSRRTLARFAEVDPGDVDRTAEDLGFGPLLRLDEAEEVLAALDDDEEPESEEESPEDDDEAEDE